MLRTSQIVRLVLLGAALWALVTLRIHAKPEKLLDQTHNLIGFITAPIGGLISVWLCKVVGSLAKDQLLPGVSLVGAVAMMMDGAALQWFSGLYGLNEKVLRLGASGLLWGYGVAFLVALLWVSWEGRRSQAVAMA